MFHVFRSLPALLLIGALACDSSTGPRSSVGVTDGLLVSNVMPNNGATNVSTSVPIVVVFNHPMMTGMELLVALHEGSVAGPTVPAAALWSADRTKLTLTPTSALKAKTTYVLQFSPNLIDANGNAIDFAGCANALGGLPMSLGMMGSSGMMGAGWQPGSGMWGYGMMLAFTTQ